MLLLLNCLRDSIEDPSVPLPGVVAAFAAEALGVVRKPTHALYPAVNAFLLQRPLLDLGDAPMFMELFNSGNAGSFRSDRAWICRVLMRGVKSGADASILGRRHVVTAVLALAMSPVLCDAGLRRLVLSLTRRAAAVPRCANHLVQRGLVGGSVALCATAHPGRAGTASGWVSSASTGSGSGGGSGRSEATMGTPADSGFTSTLTQSLDTLRTLWNTLVPRCGDDAGAVTGGAGGGAMGRHSSLREEIGSACTTSLRQWLTLPAVQQRLVEGSFGSGAGSSGSNAAGTVAVASGVGGADGNESKDVDAALMSVLRLCECVARGGVAPQKRKGAGGKGDKNAKGAEGAKGAKDTKDTKDAKSGSSPSAEQGAMHIAPALSMCLQPVELVRLLHYFEVSSEGRVRDEMAHLLFLLIISNRYGGVEARRSGGAAAEDGNDNADYADGAIDAEGGGDGSVAVDDWVGLILWSVDYMVDYIGDSIGNEFTTMGPAQWGARARTWVDWLSRISLRRPALRRALTSVPAVGAALLALRGHASRWASSAAGAAGGIGAAGVVGGEAGSSWRWERLGEASMRWVSPGNTLMGVVRGLDHLLWRLAPRMSHGTNVSGGGADTGGAALVDGQAWTRCIAGIQQSLGEQASSSLSCSVSPLPYDHAEFQAACRGLFQPLWAAQAVGGGGGGQMEVAPMHLEPFMALGGLSLVGGGGDNEGKTGKGKGKGKSSEVKKRRRQKEAEQSEELPDDDGEEKKKKKKKQKKKEKKAKDDGEAGKDPTKAKKRKKRD